ncbi:MAG: hypothetical protein ACE5NW_03930 [Acidiferrobacterales bacterium]
MRVLLGDALTHALQYPLLSQMRTFAQEASAQSSYDIRVPSLDVHAIRVAGESVVFSFNFSIVVR